MATLDAPTITRNELIDLLNGDLSRSLQACKRYANTFSFYRASLQQSLAAALKSRAEAELSHAMTLAAHIDMLGGSPELAPMHGNSTSSTVETLRIEVESEMAEIAHYRNRITQCEMLGENAIAASIRQLMEQKRESSAWLTTAFGNNRAQSGESAALFATARA